MLQGQFKMFESLTERLSGAMRKISGKATLTENNIEEALREVRRALLEADVALAVVKDFTDRVKLRAVGQEVSQSLSPGQAFIKIVKAELEAVMGAANEQLNLNAQPPAVVLMAGLQGAGKTTTVAKLARWLKESQKKSVMVVSADVYRPAAIAQLMMSRFSAPLASMVATWRSTSRGTWNSTVWRESRPKPSSSKASPDACRKPAQPSQP
jgi:signal recognition particle subunit SRP54